MSMHQIIEPAGWPRPRGYANGMVASGKVVVVAGQVGWNPLTERIVSDDFGTQTAQALHNVCAVLAAAGADPSQVVRLTWYITDRAAYLAAREALRVSFREVFGGYYPAMTLVVVAGLLEPGAKVEIEATAVIPG